MAIALFPRHDGIADMAGDLRRQLFHARLKAQADAAAEFAVPDPEEMGGERRCRSGFTAAQEIRQKA